MLIHLPRFIIYAGSRLPLVHSVRLTPRQHPANIMSMTTFDRHPYKTDDEYIAMLHVIKAYPNEIAKKSDAAEVVAILKRADPRFEVYDTNEM